MKRIENWSILLILLSVVFSGCSSKEINKKERKQIYADICPEF